MKLVNIILNEIIGFNPDFNREVEKLKKQGGKYLGSGDYGVVYGFKDKAVKVTTDDLELDHAEKLIGAKSNYFVRIFKSNRIKPGLGIIEMEKLKETNKLPSKEFLSNLEREAEKYGIDPEELDYGKANFMEDISGNLKMIDV